MKKGKKIAAGALAGLFVLSLTGCQKQQDPAELLEQINSEIEEQADLLETETLADGVMEEYQDQESQADAATGDAAELFQAFLDGDGSITNDSGKALYLTLGESYTLQEFVDEINRGLPDNFGEDMGMQVVSVKAGEIDCGNDGITDFALLVESDQEELSLPAYDYYVIMEEDGELKIKAMYESYYRSSGDLNKYGVFGSYGSNSAYSSTQGYQRVTGSGDDEFIYEIEYNLGLVSPVISRYSLPEDQIQIPDNYPEEAWAEDGGDEIECDIYRFRQLSDFGQDGYDDFLRTQTFVFTKNGEDILPDPEFMDLYDSMGITVTDKGTADGMVAERLVTLEITQEELQSPDEQPENAISWETVYTKE